MAAPVLNREDILVLLEDGPHGSGQIAQWLRQSSSRVYHELVRMAREGLVRRVEPDKRWALARPAPTPAVVSTPVAPPPQAIKPEPVKAPFDMTEAFLHEDDVDEDAETADAFWSTPVRGPGRPKLRQESPKTEKATGTAWWVEAQRQPREAFGAAAKDAWETRMRFAKLPSRLFDGQMGGS